MALSRTDETELLTALYDGPFGEPPWDVFLRRMLRRTGADEASLIFQGARAGPQEALRFFAGRDLWPRAEETSPPALDETEAGPGLRSW
jgi:hypothetical protein